MNESEPTVKQVMIRATPEDHERWKRAAELDGKTMSDFIRDTVNSATSELLDCTHPVQFRKVYPWSETCIKCGTRLRG